MTDKMGIYNASRQVPVEAQKQFSNGRFSGTDINPMWRIKKLTELFGPAGIGWYVDDVVERCETHGETTISIVTLNLYIKVDGEWSKPIYGTGGNVLLRKGAASDEGYKMAYTDALSVACKALGIGADIWFANDRTKYTANAEPEKPKLETQRREAPKPETPPIDPYAETTPKEYKRLSTPITNEQMDFLLTAVETYPEIAEYIRDKYNGPQNMTQAQAQRVIARIKEKQNAGA